MKVSANNQPGTKRFTQSERTRTPPGDELDQPRNLAKSVTVE